MKIDIRIRIGGRALATRAKQASVGPAVAKLCQRLADIKVNTGTHRDVQAVLVLDPYAERAQSVHFVGRNVITHEIEHLGELTDRFDTPRLGRRIEKMVKKGHAAEWNHMHGVPRSKPNKAPTKPKYVGPKFAMATKPQMFQL